MQKRHSRKCVLLLLAMLTPCLMMAQKKELSQARSYIKSGKDFDKAETLMTGLLKDSANRNDKRIYLVWFDAVRGQYNQANERFYLKQKQDTSAFFSLCRRMFVVLEKLDSVEMRPDKKGRVSIEYREKHSQLLNGYRSNLFAGGSYHLRKGNYQQAFDYFEQYIDCRRQPLFSSMHYDSLDVKLPEAGYWALYSAYKLNDAVRTLRYRKLALRDSLKAQFAMQYIAEARKWLKDDELYIQTLEKGFRRFPKSAYFFPRLYDSYTSQGDLKKSLALSDSALVVDEHNPLFLFAKASTLLSLGRYKESIEVCQHLMELNDQLPDVYLSLGTAYLNLALQMNLRKEKKSATEHYQKAKKYLEQYRKMEPNEKEKWGPALYKVYLYLNMGKQFDEIDRLLR